MFPTHDLWYKSLVSLMTDQPVYLTFDVDAIVLTFVNSLHTIQTELIRTRTNAHFYYIHQFWEIDIIMNYK